MAGGIQPGTEAGSTESKQLDGDVKNIAEAMAQCQSKYFYESGHKNLNNSFSKRKIDEGALPEFRNKGITLGCMPDGGMWFDAPRSQPRSLKAAFEAKHQGDGGNAIERWCKNYLLCDRLWPGVTYVTFMTGEGARPGGVLYEFGQSMTAVNGSGCVFYYAPEGFSQEGIFNIMNSVLGLGLDFETVRPYITKKFVSNFDDMFVIETEPERMARLARDEERFRLEKMFGEFSQDPSDPLYPVWHRIPRENKVEAQEIVIDMLQEGVGNASIAGELVECFLTTRKS